MNRKFTISLVRHGETMANRKKIMQGQMNTELSDLGKKQAHLLALHLKNEKFTQIFSSDLTRAAHTAQAIIEVNTFFHGHLVLDPKLRERAFGNLEGKPVEEYRLAAEQAHIPIQDFIPEGGETIKQVTDRAAQFFSELCEQLAEPLLQQIDRSTQELINIKHSVPALFTSTNTGSGCSIEHEDETIQPLPVDIPDRRCFSLANSGIHSGYSSSSNSSMTSKGSHLGLSHPKHQTSHSSVIPQANFLIVSHGLLLRELKSIILSKYSGKLDGSLAKEAHRICPNTGFSQFTMSVVIKDKKVNVTCDKVHSISSISHLASLSEDLIAQATFQGAL